MKLTLDMLRAVFQDILQEKKSFEEASNWAADLMQKERYGELEIERHKHVLSALAYLAGVDTMYPEGEYLHSMENVQDKYNDIFDLTKKGFLYLKTQNISNGITFADAEFQSLKLEDSHLIVFLNSWENKTIKVVFREVIQFSYKLEGTVARIVECLEKTPFLEESLKRNYNQIRVKYPLREFWIVDREDISFIKVIAEQVEVTQIF
jgi:hypothetical protein